jgi:hypothetical protein
MRKFIIWTVAPASLASAVLILANGWEPAAGRTFQPGACTNRHASCVDRCVMIRYPKNYEQSQNCIRRTCDKQYDNCVKTQGNRPQGSAGAEGGGVAKDPTTPPKGAGTRPPLDNKWRGSTTSPKGGTWR